MPAVGTWVLYRDGDADVQAQVTRECDGPQRRVDLALYTESVDGNHRWILGGKSEVSYSSTPKPGTWRAR